MLYWQLSALYFFYFAAVGILLPFWGLYLKHQGLSGSAIGKLMAIYMATRILAPNVWTILVARNYSPVRQVQLATFLASLTFLGVFYTNSLWGLAAVMTAFSFFTHVALPLFETLTLNYLHKQEQRYATVRLWGSIGFISTVIGLSQALEHFGTWLIPVVLAILYLGLWGVSLTIPIAVVSNPVATSAITLITRLEKCALFCVCFLMQTSHMVYYTFYTLYLTQHGYSKGLIGILWAVAVVCEVGIFLVMNKVLQRYGASRVLLTSLSIAVLRWLLIGHFPNWLVILLLAQCMHAATFAAFHASAMDLIHHYFPGGKQRLGQSLYSSLGFGAGGAVGSLASGYLWVTTDPTTSFTIAAAIALLGVIITWIWIGPQHRH